MNPSRWSPRRLLAPTAAQLDELASILMDCVEGGASVSFMQPLTRERALAFWQKVMGGVIAGERALIVAEDAQGVCGTVQLILDLPENQPPCPRHRQGKPGLTTSAELSATPSSRSALVCTNTQRSRRPADKAHCSACFKSWVDMSVSTAFNVGPTRSNAPKATRPSPVPTSTKTIPADSRAPSNTRSRIWWTAARTIGSWPGSPPCRRFKSHSAQMSLVDCAAGEALSKFVAIALFSTSICASQETKSGGAEGARTPDLLIANETLYQLSYDPTSHLF
jgi:hypothetical protein